MPHIGSIIKTNVEKSKQRHSELGRILQISPISISRYMQQKSLQCYTVWNLSKVLQVNMFETIGNELGIEKPTAINANEVLLQQRIIDLEKELAIYKDILRGKI
jgi:hypothetical protein